MLLASSPTKGACGYLSGQRLHFSKMADAQGGDSPDDSPLNMKKDGDSQGKIALKCLIK